MRVRMRGGAIVEMAIYRRVGDVVIGRMGNAEWIGMALILCASYRNYSHQSNRAWWW